MKISEIITDKYKLRIPPTVYYDLLADVQEAEEEQEPRKGHWIEHGIDESYAIPVYTCSECDHFIGVVVSNFCPNCGADMRADRSEEV